MLHPTLKINHSILNMMIALIVTSLILAFLFNRLFPAVQMNYWAWASIWLNALLGGWWLLLALVSFKRDEK